MAETEPQELFTREDLDILDAAVYDYFQRSRNPRCWTEHSVVDIRELWGRIRGYIRAAREEGVSDEL